MKQFLKIFAAVVAALIVTGGVFALIIALAFGGKDKPTVKQGSILTVNLGTPISDKPLSQDINGMVMNALGNGIGETMTLRDVLDSIDAAANDNRIKGLFLQGTVTRAGYFSGWAALKEVREALQHFKASGKPIIAYEMVMDEPTYYLTSLADELVVNPLGYMEFNGFAAQIRFYKQAFEKYGVDVQVTRVGKYKSAVEPFLLDKMSDPNREQLELLLNDIFDELLTTIAKDRPVEADWLRDFASSQGVFAPTLALDKGLIDSIAYYDDVLARLRDLTGTKAGKQIEKQIGVQDYAQTLEPDTSDNKIAIIYAEGEIVMGSDERQVGGDHLAGLLRKAREDKDVKAVVLRVNSPGGSALASEVIQRETRLIAQDKTLIVSMGTVAASGGYWISAYADQIFAQPNTITGSIGVFGMFPNIKNLINQHGITVDVAKTSEMADFDSFYRPRTDAELAILQTFVDQIYDQFLTKVSEGRSLQRETVEEIAQGRVWSGTQALELGLIDQLGGLNDAIAAAAAKAEIKNYALTEYQSAKSIEDKIMESIGFANTRSSTPVADIISDLRLLESMNDPSGVYARMPFDVHSR